MTSEIYTTPDNTHRTVGITSLLVPLNQDLLLLLHLAHSLDRNLECRGHDISRRESQPLSERDISDTVTPVDFNPNESFVVRSVLNIVAAVVWENGSVSGAEIKSTGFRSSHEDGSARFTLVEVEPFFGLCR